jgi:hypothetical protein
MSLSFALMGAISGTWSIPIGEACPEWASWRPLTAGLPAELDEPCPKWASWRPLVPGLPVEVHLGARGHGRVTRSVARAALSRSDITGQPRAAYATASY